MVQWFQYFWYRIYVYMLEIRHRIRKLLDSLSKLWCFWMRIRCRANSKLVLSMLIAPYWNPHIYNTNFRSTKKQFHNLIHYFQNAKIGLLKPVLQPDTLDVMSSTILNPICIQIKGMCQWSLPIVMKYLTFKFFLKKKGGKGGRWL